MKIAGADDKKDGSKAAQGLGTLKITNDEFQHSSAVAQLAVRLCELRNEDWDPKRFLDDAWELIQNASEYVCLATRGLSLEAGEREVERRLKASRVPFDGLCDPAREKYEVKTIEGVRHETERPKTETINGVEWKVYGSKRGFYDLFWDYWNATSVIQDEVQRREYGQLVLASWERDGVPANDFLALNKFRRERDNRAENLKKKPKSRRRRSVEKARRKRQ